MEKLMQELYDRGRRAYFEISDYTQEQIDELLENMAKKVYEHADELGEMVYEESKLGQKEGKASGLRNSVLSIWGYLKGKSSFGLQTKDEERRINTYSKGMGVVACLTPSTTNIFNGFEISMKAVKSGNAIILAPHPRAWKSSKRLADILSEAIREKNGPEFLVQSMEEPTHEKSGLLMRICDVVVGTGGAEMVKAAYSSGTPAFGVGQGDVPVIISTSLSDAELDSATLKLIFSRAADFGVPCTSPQMVFIPRSLKDKVLGFFEKNGAYIVDDEETADRIRKAVFKDGPTARMDVTLVGQSAAKIAEAYGIQDFPEGKHVILVKVKDGVKGGEDCLNREIMNPTMRYQFYDSYADAVEIMRTNLFHEGAGHSAQVWSNDQDEIDLAAKRLPVVRVLVKQTGIGVTNMTWQNGMPPSTTIGCGTWGGNSFSENLDYTTLQNNTKVIYQISEAPRVPAYEDLF